MLALPEAGASRLRFCWVAMYFIYIAITDLLELKLSLVCNDCKSVELIPYIILTSLLVGMFLGTFPDV